LCKDDIKEALLDVLGVTDRADSRLLSEASFAGLQRAARTQLQSGLSCIIEGNWRAGHSAALQQIVAAAGARSAQIWCRAEPLEIERRFTVRTRHVGHLDASLPRDELQRWSAGPPAFLDLPGPRWVFDSDDPAAFGRLQGALNTWRV
jgi:predicted kinase